MASSTNRLKNETCFCYGVPCGECRGNFVVRLRHEFPRKGLLGDSFGAKIREAVAPNRGLGLTATRVTGSYHPLGVWARAWMFPIDLLSASSPCGGKLLALMRTLLWEANGVNPVGSISTLARMSEGCAKAVYQG